MSASAFEIQGPAGGGLFDSYAYLRDEKAAGTAGGVATTGSFVKRKLTTEVFDPDSIVTLDTSGGANDSQFTITAAGTYYICCRVPLFRTQQSKVKLRDITNGADALVGTNGFSASDNLLLLIVGRVTITGATVYEVQYRVTTNDSGNANTLGIAANFGVAEIYTEVEIYREAA